MFVFISYVTFSLTHPFNTCIRAFIIWNIMTMKKIYFTAHQAKKSLTHLTSFKFSNGNLVT